MKQSTQLAFLVLLAGTPLLAQEDRPVRYRNTDPTGACRVVTGLQNNWLLGKVWQCVGASHTALTGTWQLVSATGTVTSTSFVGGLISVATATTTPALTVAGTSGGIPYFSSISTWASSGLLTLGLPVIGGGAGSAPTVGTRSGNTTQYVTTTGAQTSGDCVKIDANGNHIANGSSCGGTGTVTSASFTGGLISVGTPTVTPAFTVAGTSGGIPYFSGATTWASSGALTANLPVIGGGAGVAPSVGTRSGNTTAFVTTTGSQTSGDCVKIDASGNHVANGSGCGGSGAIYQLTDFGATKTSGTILTLGTGCSASAPCLIRIGSVVYRLTSAPTATISGTSNPGTAYVFLSSAQVLTVGHNTTTTLTCSAGCTVATSISGFPTDSTPLWAVTWTANVWDAIAESMDNRALISRNVFACGTGLTCSTDPTTGIQTGSLSSTPTDSGYTRLWTASTVPNIGTGVHIGPGWVSDGTVTNAGYTGSVMGLGIVPATGAHYLIIGIPVPTGWTGAVSARSFFQLQNNASGTGTGTHHYSLSCFVPGTTVYNPSAFTYSTVSDVAFNVATGNIGAADVPTFSGGQIPSCSAGQTLYLRIIRDAGGTAADPSIFFYVDISLPHTVQ